MVDNVYIHFFSKGKISDTYANKDTVIVKLYL